MRNFEFVDPSQFTLNDEGKITVYRFDEVARVERNGGIFTARSRIAQGAGSVATFGFYDNDVAAHVLCSNDVNRLSNPSVSDDGIGSPFISVTPNERTSRGSLLDWVKKGNRMNEAGLYEVTVEPDRLVIPTVIPIPNGIKQSEVMELLVVGDIPISNLKRIG